MKIICDEMFSTEIVNIFYNHDKHRERYINIEWVELTKSFVSRRLNVGEPMKSIEVDCIKVRGKSLLGWSGDSTNGTRYVYSGELIFTHLHNWFTEKIQNKREEKINNLLK